MKTSSDLASGYAAARQLLRHHGKSYAFATRLFPKELQDSTGALYAFFRLPDEIVDNSPIETPADLENVKRRLDQFRDQWRLAHQTGNSSDPILRVVAVTFHKHQIPFHYSEDFLAAMIQDTHQARYADYADLEDYMYGSAAVVGLMMSHVIGFSDQTALEHAKKLGYAMQLTNFLRDIDEDFALRGRVYLPQDELARFGVNGGDIETRNFGPKFRALMEFQAARCHQLYEEADLGIPMLNQEGRFPVATASALYRAILGKLEEKEWNPFLGRVKTGKIEKVKLAARAWRKSRARAA